MIHLSLRARLFASYLVLLAVTLGVIALTLVIVLGTRPAPTTPTYERLAAVAQGLNLREVIGSEGATRAEIEAQLALFAERTDVRVLVANLNQQRVMYDSAQNIPVNQQINFRLEPYTVPRLQRLLPARVESLFGAFNNPDGGEWLFAGLASVRLGEVNALILAEPRPSQSLQKTLEDFVSAVGIPLLQAGIAGLLVAFGLAYLISRSIARPLQATSAAAAAVAQGHFDQQVPESGPPEVRAVAEAFNRMSAEVRTNQAAQRDLLTNVSHDLKTPLTSIQGYSQAIIDGTAPDITQAASIIYDEAGRLNRMVVELTDLARLEAGRLSMQTSVIDIGPIARAIGQRLSVMAHKKGLQFEIDVQPTPSITGDGDRLAQVLTNLLSNAIKYTPTGGRVQLKTQPVANGVEIVVADTGIGIPTQDLPRIFERFYQVDKTRGPKRGTGLGLAIAAEIVQAHGGHISAASAGSGKGAAFTVWLPPSDADSSARPRR